MLKVNVNGKSFRNLTLKCNFVLAKYILLPFVFVNEILDIVLKGAI